MAETTPQLSELLTLKADRLQAMVRELGLAKRARTLGGTSNITRAGCLQALCEYYSLPCDPKAFGRKANDKSVSDTVVSLQAVKETPTGHKADRIPQVSVDPATGAMVPHEPEYQRHRPVFVTATSIGRIWHISDIHLFSDQNEWKWDRYEKVLSSTVRAIEEDGVADTDLMVISGDIFHKPTSPNSNVLVVFDRFIRDLSRIFPSVSSRELEARDRILVISGNHDINEAWVCPGSQRLELLESFGRTHREFFRYVRYNQVLQYGAVLVAVSSLFSDATLRLQDIDLGEDESLEDYRTVAVAHCDLLGDRYGGSTGIARDGPGQKMSFSSRHRSIEEFRGYDALLLGDIHQEQQVSAESPVAYYPGSLMQTTLGEPVGDHGILLWDLAVTPASPQHRPFTVLPEFIEIPDEYACVKIRVNAGEYIMPELPEYVRKVAVQFEHQGTTPERLRAIREEIASRWEIVASSGGPLETGGRNMIGGSLENNPDGIAGPDNRARETFTHEDPRVMELHRKISSQAAQETDHDSKAWAINRLVIDRLFNHFHTEVDFASHPGVLAVQGLNATGKTNLVNSLYMVFGVNTVDLNKAIMHGYQTASLTCDVSIGGETATISREYRLLKPRRGDPQASARAEQSNCVITFHQKESSLGSQLRSKSSAAEYIKANLNQIWFALNRVSGLSLLDMSPMARSVFLSEVFGFSHMVETVGLAKEHLRQATRARDAAQEAHGRLRREEPVVLPEDPSERLREAEDQVRSLVERCRTLQGNQVTQEEERLARSVTEEIPSDLEAQIAEARNELEASRAEERHLGASSEYSELLRQKEFLSQMIMGREVTDDSREITQSPEDLRVTQRKFELQLDSFRQQEGCLSQELMKYPANMRTPAGTEIPFPLEEGFNQAAFTEAVQGIKAMGTVQDPGEGILPEDQCILRQVPPALAPRTASREMTSARAQVQSRLDVLQSFNTDLLREAIRQRDLDRLVEIAGHILDLGLDQLGKIYETSTRVTEYFGELESHNRLAATRAEEITQATEHNARVAASQRWRRLQTLRAAARRYDTAARYATRDLNEQIRDLQAASRLVSRKATEAREAHDILRHRELLQLESRAALMRKAIEDHRMVAQTLSSRLATLESLRRVGEIRRKQALLAQKAEVDRELEEASRRHQTLRAELAEYNKLRGRAEIVQENIRQYEESAARLAASEAAHQTAQTYYTAINSLQIQYTLDKCEEVCSYANRIMRHCGVPFGCQMTAQKKSVELGFMSLADPEYHCQYTSLSGYQQFIANICLVAAINRSTVRNRLNLLVIDEGFGAIDQNNIQNLAVVFGVLRNEFRNVVVISHVNNIEAYADWSLSITNRDGVSVLQMTA
jgi:DNA repair exonuclease SbcCD nuclease subunit